MGSPSNLRGMNDVDIPNASNDRCNGALGYEQMLSMSLKSTVTSPLALTVN
jgi:hypothetical protein